MGMFTDLQERAKLKATDIKIKNDRVDEIGWLFRKVVEDTLSEIKSLGFEKVELFKYSSIPTFTLRIQPRKGYSESSYTFNMDIGSYKQAIMYGYGANSAYGKKVVYDENWNDSKLVGVMKNTLRALVSEALQSLELSKIKK